MGEGWGEGQIDYQGDFMRDSQGKRKKQD